MNTRQILKNAASNYGRMAVGIVITLFLTPLILHKLGAEDYGLWVLTLTIAGYFGLADFGITNAAIRYIAHYRALSDWPNLNKTIGSTLSCYIGMASACLLGSFIIASLAPRLFHLSTTHVGLLRLLILNMGLVSAIGFAGTMPIQCVIAAQRLDILNRWQVGVQIAIALITAIGLLLGSGLLLLAGLQLIGTIANGLIGYKLSRQFVPQVRFRPGWDKEQGKLVVSYAGLAALISLASRVIYYTDNLVIAAFLSVVAIAGYAIAMKIADFMGGLVAAGTSVLGAFASEQSALGNQDSLARMWREGTKWSLVVTLPLCAIFVCTGSDIIFAWVGQNYAGAAAALAWLAVGRVFDLGQSSGYQILMNSGRHKILAGITAAEAVANLTLSIILVRHMGILGVAIGTTLPLLVRNAIFYPLFMPHVTGLSLSKYLRQAVLPSIYTALPAILLAVAYHSLHLPKNRASVIGLVLVVAALTLLTAYHFCLEYNHRLRLKTVIRNRLRRSTASVPA